MDTPELARILDKGPTGNVCSCDRCKEAWSLAVMEYQILCVVEEAAGVWRDFAKTLVVSLEELRQELMEKGSYHEAARLTYLIGKINDCFPEKEE